MRFPGWHWALVITVGCGGSPGAPAADGSPSAQAAATPGALCVENANRERAPKPASETGDAITLKQILVHHADSKNAKEGVTRSREEACLRAIEARDKVIAGADFDETVKAYSDEAGAATRGGMVGSVRRDELKKPVANAAFALTVNEMSDVVETEFGFHLLLRAP